MSQLISAVLADDEPLLRNHLKVLLEDIWPELDVVGLAANGEEALQLCQSLSPDVVFLDINMPIKTGIQVSQELCTLASPPLIVFVTAYDEYAISAFENQAIDYLLKPLDENRLQKTVERLQKRLQNSSEQEQQNAKLEQALTHLLASSGISSNTNAVEPLKWIKASKNNVLYVVDIDDVDYFVADNKYTEVATGDTKYLIKTSITALEQQLNPDEFWRIHRNCIVRVSEIDRVEKDILGHVNIHLKNSKVELTVSRKYQKLFKQM